MSKNLPLVLLILDGWGMAPPSPGNAISLAKTPVYDKLLKTYPSTNLGATGKDVGLDINQMSGSEAGHLNLGAGRIVTQDSLYITESIENERFFKNPVLIEAVRNVRKKGSKFHVMGLMGNEDSPHSNPNHFRALLRLAKKNGLDQVYCHLFTDGRDSYSQSALTEHLPYFKKIMKEEQIGTIASISGRFYAMDRSKNWLRLGITYESIVFSRGQMTETPEEAIRLAYKRGFSDEYVIPTVIVKNKKPLAKVEENDSLVFFNLRSDRARQFSKLFVAVNRDRIIQDNMLVMDKIDGLYFVAMTDFGPDLDIHTAYPGESLENTLPMQMKNFRQLYISETEKYAHVTYFFNGGYDKSVAGEERVMIPSPVVDSYKKKPQMSAKEITDYVVDGLRKKKYDVMVINFANADMVGHTGDLKAAVKAIEFMDKQMGIIVKQAVRKQGGVMIITADHGNADQMIDIYQGKRVSHVFHTKNPVPFILASDEYRKHILRSGGVLGNMAPTMLNLLEIEKPKMMNLHSLL